MTTPVPTWEDVEWMRQYCESCTNVGAQSAQGTKFEQDGKIFYGGIIFGVTANMADIEDKTMSDGRFIQPEDFEHARSVNWVRSVINREPDFALGGLEMGHDPAPPLAVRNQRREEDQHVGGKKNAEREKWPKRDKNEKKERRQQGETKDQSSAWLRVHAGVGE
jgi:hypothetical protein